MLRLVLSACGVLLILTKDAAAASKHPPAPSTATDTIESVAVNQSDVLGCDSTPRSCPDFFGDQSVAENTKKCCRNSSILTFHAQRAKDERNCICACIPFIICPAGNIPILHHSQKDKDLFANIKCEPCADGSFEPRSRRSYAYRNPVCPELHQTCKADDGYAMVRKGNSTHDTMCRCLWEEGFVPNPNTASVCNSSVTGFKGSDPCSCGKGDPCPPNMRRNNEYKCVPIPTTTTEEPIKSNASYEEGDKDSPDVTKPKQRISKEQEADPEHRGPWWWVYLVSIFLVIFIFGMLMAYKFHP